MHAKPKHIDIRTHFIQKKVLSRKVNVGYVPILIHQVDFLTKPIAHSKYAANRKKLAITLA
jgi:hypothetical protein